MNKIAIPSLLVATIMITGAFAFMPVQEASTVHTTVQNTQFVLKTATATATGGVTADPPTLTLNTAGATQFVSLYLTYTPSAGTDELNILVNTIDCMGVTNVEHAVFDPAADAFKVELISALDAGTATTGASNPLRGTDANDCAMTFSNITGTFAAGTDTIVANLVAWTESQDALTITAS